MWDNQVASDCATCEPYHEACDVDVRIPLAKNTTAKSLWVQWVPDHWEVKQAWLLQ